MDADKAQFLSFDRVRRVYRLLGGVVGQAYHDGRKRWRNRGFARGGRPFPGQKPETVRNCPKIGEKPGRILFLLLP